MKIYSWNVNGIRAVIKKGSFEQFLSSEKPDIFCLQEIKAKKEQVKIDLLDYQDFWHSAIRPGYAGTAIFVKKDLKVLNVYFNFDKFLSKSTLSEENTSHKEVSKDSATVSLTIPTDNFGDIFEEGRILTLEFENFFLINVYVPNSKPELSRLKLRHSSFDPTLRKYLKQLELEKPVIICGDFNVAHQPIDLARPKQNERNAGYTIEEREGIANYLSSGLVDSFRFLHPDEIKYTWWSHWGKARENNIGWRIDYFLVSKTLQSCLISADIHDDILGSDHCPISINLNINKA